MERGPHALLRLLAAALLAGLVVLVLHPVYRDTALAWAQGEPDRAPIVQSNAAYGQEWDSDEEWDHVLDP